MTGASALVLTKHPFRKVGSILEIVLMTLVFGQRRCALAAACVCLLNCLLTLQAGCQQPEAQGNPLVPDTIADPIVCFDGTYYLYATTDIAKRLSQAEPLVVWKSKDFYNMQGRNPDAYYSA